jgi:prevent-host-death family protein
MYKTISALKARQNLGRVMNEVALRGDEYIIERAGKPLVAMIPMERYQSLQRDWDEFFESLSEMRANIKEEDENDMDGLIEEAIQSYRKPKAKTKRQ